MVFVQVSQDTLFFESVQLYSEIGLEMAECSVVTLVRDFVLSLFRFFMRHKALYKAILRTELEITGYLAVILGKDCTFIIQVF